MLRGASFHPEHEHIVVADESHGAAAAGGLNILDVIAGYDRLIVVDSIRTGLAAPDSWSRFDGVALTDTLHLSSVHDVNFATALALGRQSGMKLPSDDEIHIFAIEVQDNATFGERLTPEVDAALPGATAAIRREAEAILR